MITPNDALQFIKDHHNGEIPYKFGKNEYARWMAEFANHTLTKHLHKLGVVRGGDKEIQSVQLTEDDMKWQESSVTPNTPTELLTTEAGAQSQSDGRRCTHFWSANEDGMQECLFCPATRPARKSSEGAL